MLVHGCNPRAPLTRQEAGTGDSPEACDLWRDEQQTDPISSKVEGEKWYLKSTLYAFCGTHQCHTLTWTTIHTCVHVHACMHVHVHTQRDILK